MKQMFDVDLAAKEGIEAACIYNTIERTVYENRALGHCLKRGKYWADFKMCAYMYFHPYLTRAQIKSSLEKLTRDGLIEKGDFWEYTIKEKEE